jgi:hypothetical protein
VGCGARLPAALAYRIRYRLSITSTHPHLGAGCGALDCAGAIYHSNELLESGKLDTVECLCETICSLVVCADPTNLNSTFVDLSLDVAPANVDMLGAAIRERPLGEVNSWLVVLKELHRLSWSLV